MPEALFSSRSGGGEVVDLRPRLTMPSRKTYWHGFISLTSPRSVDTIWNSLRWCYIEDRIARAGQALRN